jgi:hypothetical protein
MGLAGLSLPDMLRLRSLAATAGDRPRDTAIIYVLQEGGASQLETWDPKPEAERDIRGDFNPIETGVPGIHFSEILPAQARVMDKLTILRSVHHPSTQHSSSVHLLKTGYYCRPEAKDNEMPSVGSHIARLRGPLAAEVPPYVTLNGGERFGDGHYLGAGTNPFTVPNVWKGNHYENIHDTRIELPNLSLVDGLSIERLADRTKLLAAMDRTKRILDLQGDSAGLDEFGRQAYDLVSGPAAREAFDLEAESVSLRDHYGRNRIGQSLLLARRLVERGIAFVTVGTFDWDHHGNLWGQMRRDVPAYDQGVAALVEDLFARGLEKRVLVVSMGEFGRTPRLEVIGRNKPGRDHWGDAMSVLMAGGGFAGGQVIGATDRLGRRPADSPIRIERVLATMYRHLGIDPAQSVKDHRGRPRHLLEIREPIPQLS